MLGTLKNLGITVVFVACALVLNGCVSTDLAAIRAQTQAERIETIKNLRDLIENHTDINEVRTVSHRDVLGSEEKLNATPLLAAIILDPAKVPTLIDKGADVKYIPGSPISPLECATNIKKCTLMYYWDSSYTEHQDLYSLIELLLENGADPSSEQAYNELVGNKKYSFNTFCAKSAKNSILCRLENDKSMSILKIFHQYGLEVSDNDIDKCKESITSINSRMYKKTINFYSDDIKLSDYYTDDNDAKSVIKRHLAEVKRHLILLDDIKNHGLNEVFSIWENSDQYFSSVTERMKKKANDRKHEQQIAQQRLNAKKRAISSHIAFHPDLNEALEELVSIGVERKTLQWVLNKGMFDELCSTRSDGAIFLSETCKSEWKDIKERAINHKSDLNSVYKKRLDWFAGLFGESANLVVSVVEDRIASAPLNNSIKQQYEPALLQLTRITEAEARAERAEARHRDQQRIAGIMNYMQNSFREANRMLDRNMEQTQRVISQAHIAQRERTASKGYDYKVPNTPAIRDLNKKLKEIDRSYEAQAGESSGGDETHQMPTDVTVSSSNPRKKDCIAQSESTGPMPNVPKRYCRYVFADYTDNTSFGLDDYTNEFMKESHSKESAKKALGFELLQQAKKKCEAKGYASVHHNETYELNEVAITVGQCKENNRMGSTFYLCGGTGSFICARRK